jgi:tetratricopeptide (TPR) repeat protein
VGAYFRGEWDVALGHYRASRAVRDRCGDVVGAATEDNNIGEILSDQGHLDAARPLFEAARETWTLARYRIGIALATSNLGRIAVRAGQLDEGRELLMAALANFTDIGATAYVLDTRFRLLERDVAADASSAAASARGLLADLAPRPDAGILRAGVHRLLGVVLGRSGEIDEAMNEFGRALEIARSLSATFELAATFEARSIVSGDANDRERAAELWGPLGVVLEASQVADAS